MDRPAAGGEFRVRTRSVARVARGRPFPGHTAYATCVHTLLAGERQPSPPKRRADERADGRNEARQRRVSRPSSACAATQNMSIFVTSRGSLPFFGRSISCKRMPCRERNRRFGLPQIVACTRRKRDDTSQRQVNPTDVRLRARRAPGRRGALDGIGCDGNTRLDGRFAPMRAAACKYDASKLLVESNPALERMPKTGRLFALVVVHQSLNDVSNCLFVAKPRSTNLRLRL